MLSSMAYIYIMPFN